MTQEAEGAEPEGGKLAWDGYVRSDGVEVRPLENVAGEPLWSVFYTKPGGTVPTVALSCPCCGALIKNERAAKRVAEFLSKGGWRLQ